MPILIVIILLAIGTLSGYLLWRKNGDKFGYYSMWLGLIVIVGLLIQYIIFRISENSIFSEYFLWILWIVAGLSWLFIIIKFSKGKKSHPASNSQQVYSYYEKFISGTATQINNLKGQLGSDGDRLDYSKESLKFIDVLMAEKIEKKPGYKAGLQLTDLQGDEGRLIVRLSYYFADFLIKKIGMHWKLNINKESLDYSAAVLVLDEANFELNPLRFVLESGRNGRSVSDWYSHIEKEYKH
jgi:hypothetical protein